MICPVCERDCPSDYMTKHHLQTRKVDKHDIELMCRDCHSTIHKLFVNGELRDPKSPLNTIEGLLADPMVNTQRINKSKLHYLSGRVMTKDEVAAEIPDSSILVSNMEGNGWPSVIKCRTGNFQPVDPTEHVLVAPGQKLPA